MATFDVGKRVLTTQVFSGEIVGEKKWATTQVSSHGGGGSIVNGTGFVSAPTVTSTTTTHALVLFFVCLSGGLWKLIGLVLLGFGAVSRWRLGQRRAQLLAGLEGVTRELSSRPLSGAALAPAAESPALSPADKTDG
jgi:hypothetical protein